MLTHRRALLALTLIPLVGLAGCGFQLRGDRQSSMPFKTIYLGFSPSSPLGVELSRHLRADGKTAIASDPKSADAILEVVRPEQRGRAVLGMSQGQVSEYTLSYSFTFRVRGPQDQELLTATTIALHRDQSYNPALAVAKEAEAEALYRDMQSDLIQQILRRLAAIKPATTTPTP